MQSWIIFSFIFMQSFISIVISDKINLSDVECYKPKPTNYRNGRIVGGFNALKENTVFMAALTRSGGNVFCGASIISESYLIAAAHCVCNSQNKFMKPTQMRVYIRINRISDIRIINEISSKTAPLEVIVDKIITHPDYVCGKKSDSDIVLLKVKKPIQFGDYVKPLCLNLKDSDTSNHGFVSGYGMTNEDFSIGEKSDLLNVASVALWSNAECQARYASVSKTFLVSDRQICAGGNSADACFSDSGSPLIDSVNGHLIGIVSNGIGCGRENLPGIYVRVSRYAQWIHEQIERP